ncbi:MAG TPA: serine/threonine-protein kinase [Gemmatimonadales bacterium]|jgi:serine/threonine-protein kinase|nr:serine/threonine-protein kinase [Gemmatimonadales bacterium]
MSSELAELAAVIGDRYTLVRQLARGGMATVYLAEDRVRGCPVAVKVMGQKIASALGAARFRREIEIVRSMAHPGIVPLYDSGSGGGLLYYVMPYVEGESLHERLQRTGRLGVTEALTLLAEVADALGYAHRRGIVHRDIKPDNILLSGGRALVADFGLARASAAADSQKLTATGVVVGTVYYMSPEQLREDPELDARGDVYSLGCVLYESLTGEPPFVGTSLNETITRILRAPVPSVRRLNPEVPVALEGIIARSLAKAAADRFGSIEELVDAFREMTQGSG